MDINLFKTGHAKFLCGTYTLGAYIPIAESVVKLGRVVRPASAAGIRLNFWCVATAVGDRYRLQFDVYGSPIRSRTTVGIRTSITVDLKDIFLVNQLLLNSYPYLIRTRKKKKWFSYRVLISLDQQKWTTLFDYSNFHCYHRQQLPFPMQAARWVWQVT